jgi:hypothetical protein
MGWVICPPSRHHSERSHADEGSTMPVEQEAPLLRLRLLTDTMPWASVALVGRSKQQQLAGDHLATMRVSGGQNQQTDPHTHANTRTRTPFRKPAGILGISINRTTTTFQPQYTSDWHRTAICRDSPLEGRRRFPWRMVLTLGWC